MVMAYRGRNPLQNYLEIRRDPISFLSDVLRECGDFARINVLTLRFFLVNDPALIVAKARGRTEAVIVMDDNVRPEAYWPCFQAMMSRLD